MSKTSALLVALAGLSVAACGASSETEEHTTATPEIAQETHAYIRSWFVDNYSQDVADAVSGLALTLHLCTLGASADDLDCCC